MKNAQYEQIVNEQLELAKQRIAQSLAPPTELADEQARSIIGTYRIAIEPNFIHWMYQAYQTTKSNKAKKVIAQNIRDEISQDHPKMLRDFAQQCGVNLTEDHYRRASQPTLEMWTLFAKKDGLMNLAVATTLENTSLVFIPYLDGLGKRLGCKDFTYTKVHGEADLEHARDLYEGLVEEMNHSRASWRTVSTSVDKTVRFLESILKA